jgi:methionyl-tRNA formyltransferase
MRIILLGRKPVACEALRYMKSCGAEVVAVVAPNREEPDPYPERLIDVAEYLGIPVVEDQQLYRWLDEGTTVAGALDLSDIDLVVSMLHLRRIQRRLIDLPRIGCMNFHAAPVPMYRGWGAYHLAILEDVKQWGVTAHFVDDQFDAGPVIRMRWFDVDASRETALSLQEKTQPVLLSLFKEVFDLALAGQPLPAVAQGPGRTITRKEILSRRFVTPEDPSEVVERKVRAFWYPPNPAACMEVAGNRYTLMTEAMFQDLVYLLCHRQQAVQSRS